MSKHNIETNIVHTEDRWTAEGYTGFDGNLVPPTECFMTSDVERTQVGETIWPHGSGDGGLWFRVVRVKSRHWLHHMNKEDPGFKTSYELQIGASHFGHGYHTTIPISNESAFAGLKEVCDVIRKDWLERAAAGENLNGS